jgi:hypothetical protein
MNLLIHVTRPPGCRAYLAKAHVDGRTMRATSEVTARSAADNLALRVFYGNSNKAGRIRAEAGGLNVKQILRGVLRHLTDHQHTMKGPQNP